MLNGCSFWWYSLENVEGKSYFTFSVKVKETEQSLQRSAGNPPQPVCMIINKDCIEGMKEMEESSVDCIVTST